MSRNTSTDPRITYLSSESSEQPLPLIDSARIVETILLFVVRNDPKKCSNRMYNFISRAKNFDDDQARLQLLVLG